MDEEQKFQELINAAYAKAPKEVQEYISSGSFEQFLTRVQGRYRLPVGMMTTVGSEILMALLSVTAMDELPVGLEVARIPKEIREPLVKDIKESVFDPLAKTTKPNTTSSAAAPVPAKPLAPPAPINRLAQAAAPKLLSKKQDVPQTLPVVKPVTVPVAAKSAEAPAQVTPSLITKDVPPIVPKPVAPQKPAPAPAPPPMLKPAPIFPSAAAPAPKPPLVAPVPPAPGPNTPTAPVPPKSADVVKRTDPYREPIE